MPPPRSLFAPADALDRAFVALVQSGEVPVPPYPAVAFRIQSVVQRDDFGLDEIAEIVSSDQVLSAEVIRRANSAEHSRGAPIASVSRAVSRLGAKEVAQVALASALGAHARRSGPLAPLRQRIWVDALASAVLCQVLARARGLAPDVAFSAGLLHDFGKVVVVACLEELIRSGSRVAPRTADEWDAIVDAYHVELGIVMAARWELPPVLADAISQHHATSVTAAADPRYVETVAASDQLVALLHSRPRVAAGDLQEADLVMEEERELVARTLETVPAYIAASEAGVASQRWGAPATSAISSAPPPVRWAPGAHKHSVTLRYGGIERAYRIHGLGSNQCVVVGPERLPEHVLVEMEVGCEPPLRGFASVKLAWEDKGGWVMLLQPYALSASAAVRWEQLSAA